MDKLGQIKARVMEHKSEFRRLMGLSSEDRASKYVKLQTLHVLKGIQKLTGRYVKSGGKVEDLNEVKPIKIVKEIKVDTTPSTKTKRSRKTK